MTINVDFLINWGIILFKPDLWVPSHISNLCLNTPRRRQDRGHHHRVRRVHEPGARRGGGGPRQAPHPQAAEADHAEGGQHHPHPGQGRVKVVRADVCV